MRIVIMRELGPLYGIWISRTHLKRKLNPTSKWYDPEFPKPISRGGRFYGWRSTDLEAYVASRPEYQLASLPNEEHLEPPLGKVPNTTGATPDYRK